MATPPRALEGRSERGAQSSAPEWPDVHGFARCTRYADIKPCTPGEIMYIGATLEEQIAERRPVGGAGRRSAETRVAGCGSGAQTD